MMVIILIIIIKIKILVTAVTAGGLVRGFRWEGGEDATYCVGSCGAVLVTQLNSPSINLLH